MESYYKEQTFIRICCPGIILLNDHILYEIGNPVQYTTTGRLNVNYEAIELEKHSKSTFVSIWNASRRHIIKVAKTHIQPYIGTIDNQLLEKDKEFYINKQIDNIVALFYTKVNNFKCIDDKDTEYYSRELIRKEYPGLLKRFDERYPDKRNVVEGITKFINYAYTVHNIISLDKSNPNYDNISHNIASTAYKCLENRGYIEKDGFKEAWSLLTTLYKLPGSIIKNVK